jgi:hypothetical protein
MTLAQPHDLAARHTGWSAELSLRFVRRGTKTCIGARRHFGPLLVQRPFYPVYERALTAAGKYVKHVHTCENDRGIPGSGHVEWTDVFTALRTIQYDRWVVIESFGSRIPEIAAAACIWRDLAPSSDDIAAQGLKFLQRGLGGEAMSSSR